MADEVDLQFVMQRPPAEVMNAWRDDPPVASGLAPSMARRL
jgi:hypothetical protein